jgi:DNA-binding GntR family transcriptional regulator
MNQQIHAEIARLTGNPVLQTTWAALTAKILRAKSLANFDAGRCNESINEHMRRIGSAVCTMLTTPRERPGTDQA